MADAVAHLLEAIDNLAQDIDAVELDMPSLMEYGKTAQNDGHNCHR